MKPTQHSTGIGVALAAALTLGGCAADESSEPTSTPETPPQATTAPEDQISEGSDELATPISVEATGDGPVGMAVIDPLPETLDEATLVTGSSPHRAGASPSSRTTGPTLWCSERAPSSRSKASLRRGTRRGNRPGR